MSITDMLDKQTMDAIMADAKASGISAKDVEAVLGTLTDKTKAPTRSANSQGELVSLLGDDKDAVAADIAEATGVERSTTSTILMLAAPFLLKYLFSGSSGSNNASAGSLLGSLLGGQTQQPAQTSLLGSLLGGQTQQQSYTTNSTASLLSSLMGGASNTAGQQNNGLGALMNLMGGGAVQQTQQTANQGGSGLLGALFNLLGDN